MRRQAKSVAAIDSYLAATEVAQQRSALTEALHYLQRALTLVDAIADEKLRLPRELAIYTVLGPLQLATKGYAAPEVETAFTRASELAQALGDAQQQFQALWGLSRFFLVQPNLTRGLAVSQQLLALAGEARDDGLLLEARCALGTHYFHRAAFSEATHYLEQTIAAYDPHLHADHASYFGQDPCVVASAYLAWSCWCVGQTEVAQVQVAAAHALAERIDHPYSQVIAMTYACVQEQFRDQPAACLDHAETAIALAEKYGFTLWLSMSTFLRGWAHARQGNFSAGFDDMQRSIDLYRSSGAELGAAYFTALLGDTFSRSDQHEAALILLPQALELIRRTQDRWCEAEVHRLHGDAYLRSGENENAKRAYQTAREIAQTQGAAQWAKRAQDSLDGLVESDRPA